VGSGFDLFCIDGDAFEPVRIEACALDHPPPRLNANGSHPEIAVDPSYRRSVE
jgi:hypothetical protein